jgi:hypothetical protein
MTICRKKCYISNDLDGPEDDIVWEDDAEDKYDSDQWRTEGERDSTPSPSEIPKF